MRYDERRKAAIEEASLQAFALRRDVSERERGERARLVEIEGRMAALARQAPRQNWPRGHEHYVATEFDRQLGALSREAESSREKLARLRESREGLERDSRATIALRQACEDFWKSTPLEGERSILRTAQPAKLRSDVTAQLREYADTIASIVGELEDVRRRPLPLDESLVEFERSLALEASRCTSFEGVFAAPANAEAPPRSIPLGLPAPGSSTTDLMPVLALLFPDRLRELYCERIEAFLAANPPGLPASERKRKVTELETKLHEIEVQEEVLIRMAEAKSTAGIVRRGGARPSIVLAWSPEDVAPTTTEAS